MLLDATLKTLFPDAKQKLLGGSKWHERYCILERENDGSFVMNIYKSKKSNPSSKDRGELRESITLTGSSKIISDDRISKAAVFEYEFHVIVDRGKFKFSSGKVEQRDAWITALNGCLENLKAKSLSECKAESAESGVGSISRDIGPSELKPKSIALPDANNLDHSMSDSEEDRHGRAAPYNVGLASSPSGSVDDSSTANGDSATEAKHQPPVITRDPRMAPSSIGGVMEPPRLQKKHSSDTPTSPIQRRVSGSKNGGSKKTTPFGQHSSPPGLLDTPVFVTNLFQVLQAIALASAHIFDE